MRGRGRRGRQKVAEGGRGIGKAGETGEVARKVGAFVASQPAPKAPSSVSLPAFRLATRPPTPSFCRMPCPWLAAPAPSIRAYPAFAAPHFPALPLKPTSAHSVASPEPLAAPCPAHYNAAPLSPAYIFSKQARAACFVETHGVQRAFAQCATKKNAQ